MPANEIPPARPVDIYYKESYMDNINKTLYIPLYGKAYVSKKGIILKDKKSRRNMGKRRL